MREAAERRERGEERAEAGPLRATARQNDVREPVICAVNGLVGGGGLMLVADSDATIAGGRTCHQHTLYGDVDMTRRQRPRSLAMDASELRAWMDERWLRPEDLALRAG